MTSMCMGNKRPRGPLRPPCAHIGSWTGGRKCSRQESPLFTELAPGAQLIDLKVLYKNSQSTGAQVIKVLNRAIQLRHASEIRTSGARHLTLELCTSGA